MDVSEIKRVYKCRNSNKESSRGKVCPYGSGIKEDKTQTDKRKEYDRHLARERASKTVGGHFSSPSVQAVDE